jgi:5-methylcytosine-specific restriction protein A
MARGIVIAATTPDHVIPLSHGGTDEDDNIRCLCEPCHLKRTGEQFGFRAKQQVGTDGWPV